METEKKGELNKNLKKIKKSVIRNNSNKKLSEVKEDKSFTKTPLKKSIKTEYSTGMSTKREFGHEAQKSDRKSKENIYEPINTKESSPYNDDKHSENIDKILGEGDTKNKKSSRISSNKKFSIKDNSPKRGKSEKQEIIFKNEKKNLSFKSPNSNLNLKENNYHTYRIENLKHKSHLYDSSFKKTIEEKIRKKINDTKEKTNFDGIYDNFQNFKNFNSKNNYLNLTNLKADNNAYKNPDFNLNDENITYNKGDQNKTNFSEKFKKIINHYEDNYNNTQNKVNIYNNNNYINNSINENNKLYVIESLQSDGNVTLNNSKTFLNAMDEIGENEIDDLYTLYEDEINRKENQPSFAGQTRKIYVNTIKNILDTFGILKDKNEDRKKEKNVFKKFTHEKKKVKKNNNFFIEIKSEELLKKEKENQISLNLENIEEEKEIDIVEKKKNLIKFIKEKLKKTAKRAQLIKKEKFLKAIESGIFNDFNNNNSCSDPPNRKISKEQSKKFIENQSKYYDKKYFFTNLNNSYNYPLNNLNENNGQSLLKVLNQKNIQNDLLKIIRDGMRKTIINEQDEEESNLYKLKKNNYHKSLPNNDLYEHINKNNNKTIKNSTDPSNNDFEEQMNNLEGTIPNIINNFYFELKTESSNQEINEKDTKFKHDITNDHNFVGFNTNLYHQNYNRMNTYETSVSNKYQIDQFFDLDKNKEINAEIITKERNLLESQMLSKANFNTINNKSQISRNYNSYTNSFKNNLTYNNLSSNLNPLNIKLENKKDMKNENDQFNIIAYNKNNNSNNNNININFFRKTNISQKSSITKSGHANNDTDGFKCIQHNSKFNFIAQEQNSRTSKNTIFKSRKTQSSLKVNSVKNEEIFSYNLNGNEKLISTPAKKLSCDETNNKNDFHLTGKKILDSNNLNNKYKNSSEYDEFQKQELLNKSRYELSKKNSSKKFLDKYKISAFDINKLKELKKKLIQSIQIEKENIFNRSLNNNLNVIKNKNISPLNKKDTLPKIYQSGKIQGNRNIKNLFKKQIFENFNSNQNRLSSFKRSNSKDKINKFDNSDQIIVIVQKPDLKINDNKKMKISKNRKTIYQSQKYKSNADIITSLILPDLIKKVNYNET